MRAATNRDASAIASLWIRSREASFPAIPKTVHSDEEIRRWVSDVLLPDGGTWVIEDEGQPVGMMSLRDGWIDQLYIDPEHVGQGRGSKLVAHAKLLCPEGLDLWTFQSNTRARHFYETHGFRPVRETTGDNEEGAPDVQYHWDGRGSESSRYRR